MASDPIVIDLHGRVSALEKSEASRNTEIALIKRELEYIRGGQDKINSGLNKLFWTIVISLVGATTTFVISGGLAQF